MTGSPAAKPRLLHCFGAYGGASSQRAATLITAFGSALGHDIVVAGDMSGAAAQLTLSASNARYLSDFPEFSGKPMPGKLARLAQAMAQYDLVLTYDWGALNMAMAHTAFAQNFNLPPLIHHEIGFGAGGARETGMVRNWYRRIALGRAFGLVVESEQLEGVALGDWQQPIGRVRRIMPGIQTADFAKRPAGDALRGIIKRDGEYWLGVVGSDQAGGALGELIAGFASLPVEWQLVIWGEGLARDAIRAQADRLEISHRVHLPGTPHDWPSAFGLMDIYVQVGAGAAFPLDMVRAMAAGLPIVAADTVDTAALLAPENQPLLFPPGDMAQMAGKLELLAYDAPFRAQTGAANRQRAHEICDETRMVDAYRRLYASALGREIA